MLAFLQLFLAHFGFWMAVCVGLRLWKKGLPRWHQLKEIGLVSLVISATMGILTAHSHMHLLALLAKV